MKTNKIRTPQTAIQMCELIRMIVEKRPDLTGPDILDIFVKGTSNHARATGVLQARGMLPMTEQEQEEFDSLMALMDQRVNRGA